MYYTWIYEYLQPGGNYRNYCQSSGIPKKYSNTHLVIADYETAGGPCDLSMLTISPDTDPQRILQQLTSPSPCGGLRFVAIWCMSGAEKSIHSNVSHFLPSVCMILTLRCLQQLFRSWNRIHGRSFEEPEHQPSLSQATLTRKPVVLVWSTCISTVIWLTQAHREFRIWEFPKQLHSSCYQPVSSELVSIQKTI
ncbi:hypothetical protein M422DRAFT_249794 [Sphaerobolus stellatus SS14]|uniref:Uncharacterized protein n=1 Tax=Sphaerobolus stellatus (strain SS14) TaxID=990650 RepID=A0A0C9W4T4_SPHS4|nr:hypothetical protein M422DRAFT_249794 [Sphaerobolus stellatus SS14]